MADTATKTVRKLTQKELQEELRVSKWFIDVRIRRNPPGSAHPFPVERFGTAHLARRRFDLEKVRAWLEAEANGFAGSTVKPCTPSAA
ncbi:hypothetical protein ACTWP5_27360 [Streptomyces sp. 4N509B]|uniref:hypothetical protein n=1 Tax=Streptomyces sp. 4N509B TaxID=3457413 RepID=UPI003FD11FBC